MPTSETTTTTRVEPQESETRFGRNNKNEKKINQNKKKLFLFGLDCLSVDGVTRLLLLLLLLRMVLLILVLLKNGVLASDRVVAMDARVRSHLRTRDEVVEHFDPRVVARNVVVVLGRYLANLGQTIAGYVGEVVMLVVVADVEGDEIERTVVRVGLVALDEHVVLGYEVTGDGMKAEAEQCAADQVEERLVAACVQDEQVEGDLHDAVLHLESVDLFGHFDDGTNRVEEGQHEHVNDFADGRGEQASFNARGQVGIPVLDAEILVVVAVVLLERDECRHGHGQIGKVAE